MAKILREKHMKAAMLIVDGWSIARALLASGYAPSTAQGCASHLRRSSILRKAIREEQIRRRERMIPRPKVRKRPDKYSRRAVALFTNTYVDPFSSEQDTNRGAALLHRQELAAARASGVEPRYSPNLIRYCSLCGGRTEGRDHWCPNCQRVQQ